MCSLRPGRGAALIYNHHQYLVGFLKLSHCISMNGVSHISIYFKKNIEFNKMQASFCF